MDRFKRDTSKGTNLVGDFGSGWALGSCEELMLAWEAGQASQRGALSLFLSENLCQRYFGVMSNFLSLTHRMMHLLSFSKSCFAALFNEK